MVNASITSNSSTAPTVVDWTARHMAVASVVIYSVVLVIGTVGNGLVIYVTGCRMKKTVNSVWFLNLALADFLFTAFLLFLAISTSKGYWQFGFFMCKLNSFVSVVNMFASVFLLMAISLDRCLSIWVVVWAQNKRTVNKAQIITAVIWVAAVICSTPYATFRDIKEFKGQTYCVYASGTPFWTLSIFRFIMGFFIPFLVICVSYGAIGVRARRLQRTRNRRSRRIILCVVLAFFICWLPFHVVQLIELWGIRQPELRNIVNIVGPISVFMAFTNSCLNPILYVFMCDEFQKKLKQSICHVLESALAEDHLSFMSSRSLSSHLSRISRKSESSTPTEKKDTALSLHFTESKVIMKEERETLSTD